ncbi:MAG TPA: hypothetical protein VFU05_11710 [Cyclobacteriaceae bacterium]|nr:hypothetical protein [Cyclobacteriaceae bacterium]
MTALRVTTRMAIAIGILLPLAETIRRANQLLDLASFMLWFDDYILGGLLIIAAWRVLKQKKNSLALLTGVWGIGVGALFLSFLGQFNYLKSGDPGLFDSMLVLVVKGLILAYMIVGLWLSVRASDR